MHLNITAVNIFLLNFIRKELNKLLRNNKNYHSKINSLNTIKYKVLTNI